MQHTEKSILFLIFRLFSYLQTQSHKLATASCEIFYQWHKIFICALAHGLICHIAFGFFPHFQNISFNTFFTSMATTFFASLLIAYTLKVSQCLVIHCKKNATLSQHLEAIAVMTIRLSSPTNIIKLLFILILTSLFSVNIDNSKALIPYIKPFALDPQLQALDHIVLLGKTTWQLMSILHLNQPLVIRFFDLCYILWFVFLPLMLIYATMDLSNRASQYIFIAYISNWIVLGNIVATLCSSAGPCFYHFLPQHMGTTPADITKHIAYLNHLNNIKPLFSVQLQKILGKLWHHSEQIHQLGASVSAFPSLHVGCATLIYLISNKHYPKIKVLSAIFLGLIFLGSVILGWHYWVDGIAAILGTFWTWNTLTPWLHQRLASN